MPSAFDLIAGGKVAFPYYANLGGTATTSAVDPTSSNDITQGYEIGSLWFNSNAGFLRIWSCRSNTAGNAAWVFEGADYTNGGTNPSAEITQFGSGTGAVAEEGNIYRQVTTGVSPGGTGADYVLAVYAVPANSFDGVSGTNRGLTITAMGSFAANSNLKRVKIWVGTTVATVGSVINGGTVIADSGGPTLTSPVGVAGSAGGWAITANIFKYGAANSNTQLGLHEQAQYTAASNIGAVSPMVSPTLLTLTENAAFTIAVTGAGVGGVSNANDIVFTFLQVNAMN